MGANEIQRIAKRYRALCEMVPLKSITSESAYAAAIDRLNQLLDAGGADQRNELAGLVDALGQMIQAYEQRRHVMPDVHPRDMLRYLMEDRGLNQTDLADVASQGTISDILAGKRDISKALARKLADRFGVSVAVFV